MRLKQKNARRPWLKKVAFAALALGLALLLLPYMVQWIYQRQALRTIDGFERAKQQFLSFDAPPDVDSARLFAEMQAYNQRIYDDGQSELTGTSSFETVLWDLTEYGFDDNIIGYVQIDRLGLDLPIYLGAGRDNLKKGVGHLTNTSLPIGGANTNCVLAAHRGMSSATMFRNIDKIELGDTIIVTNLWNTLEYRVVKTKVIAPTDIKEILIQDGKDMLTLISCHPYPLNDQRFVVYCEFVEPSA